MGNATPENQPSQNDSAEAADGYDSPASILEKQIAQSMPNMDARMRKSLARLGASIAMKETAKPTADDTPNGQEAALPPCPQDRRAAPNAVFRSALFPALNFKESRPFLKGEKLASVEGVDVYFTGERFDQSDLDVYHQRRCGTGVSSVATPRRRRHHARRGVFLCLRSSPQLQPLRFSPRRTRRDCPGN